MKRVGTFEGGYDIKQEEVCRSLDSQKCIVSLCEQVCLCSGQTIRFEMLFAIGEIGGVCYTSLLQNSTCHTKIATAFLNVRNILYATF
jgi:hypothetical protein